MKAHVGIVDKSVLHPIIARLALVSPNHGLRRYNSYFPPVLPDHMSSDGTARVIAMCYADHADESDYYRQRAASGCDDDFGTVTTDECHHPALMVWHGTAISREDALGRLRCRTAEMLIGCLRRIQRRVGAEYESTCQRVLSAGAAVLDFGGPGYGFSNPMGCSVRTSVSLRGARRLATQYGGTPYTASEAAAILVDERRKFDEMIDAACEAASRTERNPA